MIHEFAAVDRRAAQSDLNYLREMLRTCYGGETAKGRDETPELSSGQKVALWFAVNRPRPQPLKEADASRDWPSGFWDQAGPEETAKD